MKKLAFFVSIIALSFSTICPATSWGNAEVDDPINPSYKCKVHQAVSTGGYIYRLPSKYDQVFWPLTEQNGIWHCERTGFTALIDDFQNITPDERKSIARYLKSHYKDSVSTKGELLLLEACYALRQTDERFKIRLLRVLAYQYQESGALDKANLYRKKALKRIQKSLKGTISENQKLEYLYVAANYTRLFGDATTSDRYIRALNAAIGQLQDKELSGFAEYLSDLVKETPRIKLGGILNPSKIR
jgi:uncharacterized protein (DUF2225 family)